MNALAILTALKALSPPAPTLHIYAQPPHPAYYEAQQSFAAGHSGFEVRRISARSHFPMLEEPEEMAQAVEDFVERLPVPSPVAR